MIKVGIFVEGQTERIFVVKFLSEYLNGEHNFSRLELKRLGDDDEIILTQRRYPNAKYYFLIYDASGDGKVFSALKDRAENMIVQEGYKYLIALRDLYPLPRGKKQETIKKFENLFSSYVFKDKIKLALSIMEIEAWFLADYNLFKKINVIASSNHINKQLAIDLVNKNPESFPHPAAIIGKIYNLFGQKYKKREKQAYQLAYKIDYKFLLSKSVLNKVESLKHFFECIKLSIK